MEVCKHVLGGEQRFLGSRDNGLMCVCYPWVNIGVILVCPPLKSLWCQTQWNVCLKGSMGRGEGDKLHSAHCCQFAPHVQEGEVAVHVALGYKKSWRQVTWSTKCSFALSRIGVCSYWHKQGKPEAILNFCCEIHRMKCMSNFEVFISFWHRHQSLLMSLPILLKRKLTGASINLLFILFVVLIKKKIPQDQPTNKEVDYKCKVPAAWYCLFTE